MAAITNKRNSWPTVLLAIIVFTVLVSIVLYILQSRPKKSSNQNQIPAQSLTPGGTIESMTDDNQLVFAANIKGSNINTNQLKAANLTEATYWIYLPEFINSRTKQLETKQLLTKINLYSLQRGMITVKRTHIMPQTAEQAKKKGGFYLPEDLGTYSGQIKNLVQALKTRFTYYSISNEVPVLWGDTLPNYVTLLKTSYSAIKSADPNAIVLDSGLESGQLGLITAYSYYQSGETTKAINFINGYFSQNTTLVPELKGRLPLAENDYQGLRNIMQLPSTLRAVNFGKLMLTDLCPYYDQLQLHYYSQWQYLSEVLALVEDQMVKNNCQKPIQFWELGYGLDSSLVYDVNDHAMAIPKYLTIAATVSKFIDYSTFYEKNEFMKGLYNADSSFKPTATAFNVTTDKLRDSQFLKKLALADNVWAYQFTKNGTSMYILWSSQDTTVNLPTSSPLVLVTDIQNETTESNPSNIAIGPSPIFVETKPAN